MIFRFTILFVIGFIVGYFFSGFVSWWLIFAVLIASVIVTERIGNSGFDPESWSEYRVTFYLIYVGSTIFFLLGSIAGSGLLKPLLGMLGRFMTALGT